MSITTEILTFAVADPGFPVGGAWTSYGGPWTPEAAAFQKILHVKTKESRPVGGGVRWAHPPRSANASGVS